MSSEEATLNTFYQAFQKLDYKTMASCYHKDAEFGDEVFDLQNKEIHAMWHMLCEKAKDFKLTYVISQNGSQPIVTWQANYTFSQTGRSVENIITASFKFKDGKIINHKDSFDFWRWSRQALGMSGLLLGWSAVFKNKVKSTAKMRLDKFIERQEQYQAKS
ncbi:hypothetical protein MED121_00110 [Marinomonas sp. MED121]|uniref:nuclear transport factor 2 family protein n=1 Tax=Marinomonas sp. MED121 TaxID=314277 RepID=UPI0000690156|nr:nuclear transport factor 2 family protein [Marinomonas sp. MED121]EAQ63302.1 hypothetical protein MED121_00110 [Marinomonas sp. MED121]